VCANPESASMASASFIIRTFPKYRIKCKCPSAQVPKRPSAQTQIAPPAKRSPACVNPTQRVKAMFGRRPSSADRERQNSSGHWHQTAERPAPYPEVPGNGCPIRRGLVSRAPVWDGCPLCPSPASSPVPNRGPACVVAHLPCAGISGCPRTRSGCPEHG
jgi:hypothetical protein